MLAQTLGLALIPVYLVPFLGYIVMIQQPMRGHRCMAELLAGTSLLLLAHNTIAYLVVFFALSIVDIFIAARTLWVFHATSSGLVFIYLHAGVQLSVGMYGPIAVLPFLLVLLRWQRFTFKKETAPTVYGEIVKKDLDWLYNLR